MLGALLNVEDAVSKIGSLRADDFILAEHRLIFEAISELEKSGDPTDRVTVDARVRRHRSFSDFPNLRDYLAVLEEENFSSERLEHYAGIVREHSVQRKLIRTCQNIVSVARDPEGRGPGEVLDFAEQSIREVSDASLQGNQDLVTLRDASWSALKPIEDLYERRKEGKGKFWVTGTPTGFPTFDNRTSGLQGGELVILAASPGMGKTSLALNIALNIARGSVPGSKDGVVAMFSMEMSASQLALRVFAVLCEVDLKKVTTADLSDADYNKIFGIYEKVKGYNLHIQQSAAATPSLIQRMCQRVKAEHQRLDLIIIDYLQLIRSDIFRPENRNIELSNITRELKAIALKLDTPILCLSQLNRVGSKREAGDAPKLQELRDSGAIEQDADMVMFLYKSSGQDEEETANSDYVTTTLEVAKNRNGPTFQTQLMFSRPYTLFREYAGPAYEGEAQGHPGS